jgi:2-polyprenyl-6-methoxyphenol hydroxylase-like FAD-dependent oxidoreductase
MASIAILGGSVIGSATALQFARSGWQVTLVDPEFELMDRASIEPSELVVRPGAPHSVQAHGFPARARYELGRRLPDVVDELLAAGAMDSPFTPPPHLHDGGRPEDVDLHTFRTRRVALDRVITAAVRAQDGIRVLPTRAVGLEIEDGTPPRATGFALAGGEVVRADVLVDAGGRRSPVADWLAAEGVVAGEVVDECGLSYYGRHFSITGDRPPLNNPFADVHEFPTHLQLGFLGDNDTMMMALSPHADDRALKVLRHESAFMAALAANEAFADWLKVLTPETDVFCLGSLKNRMRSLAPGDRPLVLGLHQVGDALAMTNPNRGRGISMGLAAVGRLHDLVTTIGQDAEAVTMEYAAWQRDVLAVYYREAAATDAELGSRLRANLLGTAGPPTAPSVELPDGHPVTSRQIEAAAQTDPDLFRAFVRALSLLDDDRMIASPQVTDAVLRAVPDEPPRPGPPSPGRVGDREAWLKVLEPFS